MFNLKTLKVGSLFVSDNFEQKIIFRFFSKFLSHLFGVKNLKVGKLFVFDNSEQKMNFRKSDVNLNF